MEHGAGEWSISGSLGSFSGSVSCPTAVQKTEATPPVVHLKFRHITAILPGVITAGDKYWARVGG